MSTCYNENELNEETLNKIADSIKDGKVIIFPTETVYGIGVNGFDEEAIKKIYEIKQRPYNKPISLLVNSFSMIEDVAESLSDIERVIIDKFFPGPLTLVVKKNKNIPDVLTSGTDYVGVRMPKNKTALRIINAVKVPMATTSTNISGMEADIDFEKAYSDFKDKVDYFIDGGVSKLGIASTVIQVIDDKIKVLREGIISKEEIEQVIKED
jgi:L-threonylcarbamoyladenylate synthase